MLLCKQKKIFLFFLIYDDLFSNIMQKFVKKKKKKVKFCTFLILSVIGVVMVDDFLLMLYLTV